MISKQVSWRLTSWQDGAITTDFRILKLSPALQIRQFRAAKPTDEGQVVRPDHYWWPAPEFVRFAPERSTC